MRRAKGEWRYPPAPQGFPEGAEVFICHDYLHSYPFDRYCGAWAKDSQSGLIHKFIIPGSERDDGMFSDPLEARDALNKYLEGLKR